MSELVHHTWQGPNYTGNQSAAEALAQKIVDFWRQRGGDIDIRIETSAVKINRRQSSRLGAIFGTACRLDSASRLRSKRNRQSNERGPEIPR
jgi:hypothetical protein